MDQNPNPQDTNNVFEQNEGQPFARRTVSWAFNLGLIVLVMGLFAGWYFSASDEPDGGSDVQMPGNRYEEDSVRGSVYDFFYGVFSGFGNGSSAGASGAAPLRSPAVSNVPAMPVKASGASTQPTSGDEVENVAVQDSIIVPSSNESDIIPAQNSQPVNAAAITPETAPSYFDGKILDYEGKIAGDIKATIRNDDGERIVYFTLDQSLTPADKPRDYHIAYDEVEIAEEEGARFIRLNKEQTEALAQTLFESDEEQEARQDTQSPEPE